MGKRYYSLNEYLQATFGKKIYKLALNGGFSCPNRDGTIDTRGCIFCLNGSGDFAAGSELSIYEQIEAGKELIKNKIKSTPPCYIAYFQAYTNTYGRVDVLKKLFLEAINHPDIVAISIATRPDCLPREVLDLLAYLNKIKPVFVELGLQTIHEDTAEYIRRGYNLNVYDRAVADLQSIGIPQIITHIIIGLPGENKDMMKETVKHAIAAGSNGLKLQLLHVLKNTDLAKDYEAGKFNVLSLEEYIEIIDELLEIIPKNVVIHRLTGDGPKKDLIAPMWSADKKFVLSKLNSKFL